MDHYMKYMSEKDTVLSNFKCYFRKLPADSIFNVAFHYQREPVYDTVNQYWSDIGTISNPHWIMENFIGIGFVFELYKNVQVFQEAGFGCAIWGNNPYSMNKILFEWDYTLKLGLLYRFASSQ